MKIFNKIFKRAIPAACVLLVASSCADFLDINENPNDPLTTELKQNLPVVETVIFEAFGHSGGGLSDITSQFVNQTVQRGPTNFYFVQGNEFAIANSWPNMFSGALKDLDLMIASATERESWHYLGVAQILKAYSFSMMVDVWGNVPYTEFGLGTANPFPKFDEGEEIYPKLLVLLEDAVENLEKESNEVLENDLIFSNDEDTWKKFGNALRLKLYNQVKDTPLYDAAAVADIINNADLPIDVADGFRLKYTDGNNPENRHPLFKKDYVDNNASYIDPFFYRIMDGSGEFNPDYTGIVDPRIPYYFYNQLAGDDPQNPPTSAYYGDFLSIWFASYNIDPNEGFDQAQSQTLVGLYPCGGAFDDGSGDTGDADSGLKGAGYQRLYPYFAHLYTMAELALTKGAPGDARDLFEAAMVASFDEVNDLVAAPITPVDGDDYIEEILALYDDGDDEKKLELIMTQKWIASFGFSVDSYTDYRRTGYPILFDPNADDNPFTVLTRNFPVSFPYFTDDLAINPNSDPQRDPGTDKVFWDVD